MKRALFSIAVTSLLLTCFGWFGNAAAQGPPADDGKTLILLLKPGADLTRVANIVSGVNGTVLRSTAIKATGQRLLKVQVPMGRSADAEKSIGAAADPDISALGRNYYLQLQNQRSQMCSPNDPDFPQQWALPDMNYPEALCRTRPTRIPAMTYIDSGVNPVYPFELFLIQQLNFANGADGVREYPFDSDINDDEYHGTGTSGTGGATTNDHEFIAGVASVR